MSRLGPEVVSKCQQCSAIGPHTCTPALTEVTSIAVIRIGNRYYPREEARQVHTELGKFLGIY